MNDSFVFYYATGTPQIACDVPSIKENLIVKIEIS